MKPSIVAFVATVAVIAAGCGAADSNQTPVISPMAAQSQPALAGAEESAAAAYCVKTGGKVYWRTPEYDTNSSKPLVLAGRAPFCQYTATTTDGSRIHILLTTLYSKKPSLAALAYISAPKVGTCNGNPASCYCSLLGGSDQFGGAGGAGGGWVNVKSEDADLEACIFPDMSSIDSWGLTYHAEGIIRGIDLTKVMRYKYKK